MEPVKKSLLSFLRENALEIGDRAMLYSEAVSYSAREIYDISVNLALFLKARGIEPGTMVALRCVRSVETPLPFFALQALGAITVLCDAHLSLEETLNEAESKMDVRHFLDFDGRNWIIDGEAIEFDRKQADESKLGEIDVISPAVIVFTSGSTGKGKAVVLSQYNYINHQLNFEVVGGYLPQGDNAIQMLPLHHVFGFTEVVDGVISRCPIFFPDVFALDAICGYIEKYRFTRFGFVPSFAKAMAQYKEEKGFDSSSLKIGVLAGAPSTKEEFDFIESSLGITLIPVYGQSECIGISGAGEWENAENRASSVGKPLPMNEVKIDASGEILVKSPAIALGYYSEKGLVSLTDKEGYLHTGDLGYLDEGNFLHITGRIKDIIIRNGNNLSARAIEEGLSSLPFVRDAAVVGIKDDAYGEVPVALITLKKGTTYDENAIKGVLRKIELPKEIKIVEELPLTSAGKVDKVAIREMFGEK